MKGSHLYMSVTNEFDDYLATDLVFIIRNMFPFTHLVGVSGPRLSEVGLESLIDLDQFAEGYRSEIYRGRMLRKVLETLIYKDVKAALLVGLNDFHKELARDLHKAGIPCFLYALLPSREWRAEDFLWAQENEVYVLSAFAETSHAKKLKDVRHRFLGLPVAARFHKLRLGLHVLGAGQLDPKPVFLVAAPREVSEYRKALPFIEVLVDEVGKQLPQYNIVINVMPGCVHVQSKSNRWPIADAPNPFLSVSEGSPRVYVSCGGREEWLAAASLTLTFSDLDRLACGVLGRAHLRLVDPDAKQVLNTFDFKKVVSGISEDEIQRSGDHRADAQMVLAAVSDDDLMARQKKALKRFRQSLRPVEPLVLRELLSPLIGRKQQSRLRRAQ